METRGKVLAARALDVWPRLVVDKALIDADERKEMLARAKRRDLSKVPMTSAASALFEQLRVRVKDIDDQIIEIAESKSVSYHGPAFFLEVIPRKSHLTLLLDLDFNEANDSDEVAKDAAQYHFFCERRAPRRHIRVADGRGSNRAGRRDCPTSLGACQAVECCACVGLLQSHVWA